MNPLEPTCNMRALPKHLSLIVIAVILGVCVLHGAAAPKPKPAPTDWLLSFTFADPVRIDVQLPGQQTATPFWYMLYTVANETGEDVSFYPDINLVTDSFEVTEGGANVHPKVYDVIKALNVKEHPFFAPPSRVTGPILQGRDNARTSAVVFRQFDADANSFTVYVSGLSGEMQRVPNPTYDPDQPESDDNPRFFVLRRTLAIHYDLPGDIRTRSSAAPIRRSREWVMR